MPGQCFVNTSAKFLLGRLGRDCVATASSRFIDTQTTQRADFIPANKHAIPLESLLYLNHISHLFHVSTLKRPATRSKQSGSFPPTAQQETFDDHPFRRATGCEKPATCALKLLRAAARSGSPAQTLSPTYRLTGSL
jgi:hypothetical protein